MTQLHTQINNYLNYCQLQKMLNSKTLKAYRIDLKQFEDFFVDTTEPYCKESINSYVQALHAQFKPKTVKRKIACIRAFINYLEYDEQIVSNPISKMHLEVREPFTLPKALPLSTIRKLLKTAYKFVEQQNQSLTGLRDIAVLELLFATGLRVSELCSIEPKHLNLKNGFVRIQGKGSRERIIFIGNHDTLSALHTYQKTSTEKIPENKYFFINRLGNRLSEQSVRGIIRKYAKIAQLKEDITPHMLRHSFATLMLEEDVDIRYIQSILGHSSITTTQIYTHVSLIKQKSIMRKKHPRNRINL